MNARQRRARRRAHERFVANWREVDGLWYVNDEADRRMYGMMDRLTGKIPV